MSLWKKIVGLSAVSVAAALVGCDSNPPPPPEPNPQAGTVSAPSAPSTPGTAVTAPTGKVVEGGQFNRYFPSGGGGYTVRFTQEKKGYAEASLEQNGKQVGVLSISDIAGNPAAINKYSSATSTLSGNPMVTVGTTTTSLLVGNRFQVQVRTAPGANLPPQERETWLSKFKLNEIANLK